MARWRVTQPDGTHKHFSTKSAAQESIDKAEAERFSQKMNPLAPQRCITGVKRQFLLHYDMNPYVYNGLAYQVVWKSLGAGVHEARMKLLENNNGTE